MHIVNKYALLLATLINGFYGGSNPLVKIALGVAIVAVLWWLFPVIEILEFMWHFSIVILIGVLVLFGLGAITDGMLESAGGVKDFLIKNFGNKEKEEDNDDKE